MSRMPESAYIELVDRTSSIKHAYQSQLSTTLDTHNDDQGVIVVKAREVRTFEALGELLLSLGSETRHLGAHEPFRLAIETAVLLEGEKEGEKQLPRQPVAERTDGQKEIIEELKMATKGKQQQQQQQLQQRSSSSSDDFAKDALKRRSLRKGVFDNKPGTGGAGGANDNDSTSVSAILSKFFPSSCLDDTQNAVVCMSTPTKKPRPTASDASVGCCLPNAQQLSEAEEAACVTQLVAEASTSSVTCQFDMLLAFLVRLSSMHERAWPAAVVDAFVRAFARLDKQLPLLDALEKLIGD